jgi:maltose alpha-D-glucosyltransferase/alpha-amylase
MEEPLVTFAASNLEQLLGDADMLRTLRQNIIPNYLSNRRWFGAKGQSLGDVTIDANIEFPLTDIKIAQLRVVRGGRVDIFLLPLTLDWDGRQQLSADLALARVQRNGQSGLLTDGFSLPEFAFTTLRCLTYKSAATQRAGDLEFVITGTDPFVYDTNMPIRWLSAEQSNSSLIIGDALIVKLIRHVFPGIHPEVEMTRHLTRVGYKNTASLIGETAVIGPDGARSTFLIVQKAIANQGDAWTWMLSHLRAFTEHELSTELDPKQAGERLKHLVNFCGRIGQRLAELHVALAQPTDDENFRPVIVSPDDALAIGQGVHQQVDNAFDVLREYLGTVSGQRHDDVANLLQQHSHIISRIQDLAKSTAATLVTRTHGDFHLGQVLVSGDDAFIIDFEGEPAKNLDQRRAKAHPLRDAAGVLRSIDYLTASVDGPEGSRMDLAVNAMCQRFGKAAKDAFLGAYTASHRVLDGENAFDNRDNIIKLFLLEKASYEVVYEARNRPQWLPIAIDGLMTIVSQVD